MSNRLFLFFSTILLLGCNNDDNGFISLPIYACDLENPLENLDWLKSEVMKRKSDTSENTRYCYISQAELNGNTFFLYEDCNPFVNKLIAVYDCTGENKGFVGDDNFGFDLLQSRTVIFYPKNTLCEFGTD